MRVVLVKSAFIRSRAFTIIEMLVATAVFMMMVVLLVSVVSQVNTVWQQTDAQKSRRQSGRALLDLISKDLQAALGPLDEKNPSKFEFNLNPAGFAEKYKSALFWQCSSPGARSDSDIVTVGYFVRRTSSNSILCRLQAPGSVDSVWSQATALAPATQQTDYKGLAAEGVLAMFVTLYDKKGTVLKLPDATYSAPDLPYSIDVALVIADAKTTTRMIDSGALGPLNALGNADDFINNVPDQFRSGVQMYRTRFDLPSAR